MVSSFVISPTANRSKRRSAKIDKLLYLSTHALVAILQALPLTLVARLGHAGGGLAFWLDVRHRRVALKNLSGCFGREKSPEEIRALAQGKFPAHWRKLRLRDQNRRDEF